LIKKEKPLVGRDVFSKIKLKLKLKLKKFGGPYFKNWKFGFELC
jgi:hypothetical protein